MKDNLTRATFDQCMVPNYNPAAFIPVRGAGSRVWDQSGREYIDLAGGIAVNALGHCHPELIKVLSEQSQKLWHISNLFTNEPVLELARQLTELTFAERAFFCNSGAESNEAALKLARKYASDHFAVGKHQIIACKNSFHGRTLFTVSTGGQAKYCEGLAPLPAGIAHTPYNDTAALEQLISEDTCAVVIEPVQGEGGVIPATVEFLQAARSLCDKHNALLIFDEVQTGVGRTGQLFAYMHYGVVPDILTTAKGLGSGFPIGCMLTRSKIAASFTPGTHGTTFGGNPLAASVANKVVQIVSQPETLARVEASHQLLQQGLKQINGDFGVFAAIRGVGLLLGCELQGALAGRASEVVAAAANQGVLILQAGPGVLRFAPSLLIEDCDIEQGLQGLSRALAALIAE